MSGAVVDARNLTKKHIEMIESRKYIIVNDNSNSVTIYVPTCTHCDQDLVQGDVIMAPKDPNSITMIEPDILMRMDFRCPNRHYKIDLDQFQIRMINKYPMGLMSVQRLSKEVIQEMKDSHEQAM